MLFFSLQAQAVDSDRHTIQRNAMALAKSGQHQQAIRALNILYKQHRNDPSLRRDLMVAYAWAGDCHHALRLYRHTRADDLDDRNSIQAAGKCLLEQEFYLKAIGVLTPAQRKYRNDREIRELYARARSGHESLKPWFHYSGAEGRKSDVGLHGYGFESEIFRKTGDSLTIYARLNLTQDHEPVLADGSLKRLGTGFDFRVPGGLVWREEFSGSIAGDSDPGLLSRVTYSHSDKLELVVEHSTFAEDIPLPAAGLGIKADRTLASLSFHSDEYVYEGSATINHYRYSDSNIRQGGELDLAYAYDREADRWRRAGLYIDHVQNTLAGVGYFNPGDANTIILYHSWEIPRQSRFRKRQDTVTLKGGLFAQEGYASEYISELLYEQKYTLTGDASIEVAASIASVVYDGQRETEALLRLGYARSF